MSRFFVLWETSVELTKVPTLRCLLADPDCLDPLGLANFTNELSVFRISRTSLLTYMPIQLFIKKNIEQLFHFEAASGPDW